MSTVADTASSILDAAEKMTQAVGYNGLSFRELGKVVGIKSASVHYHFPSKGQLGAAVARRYADRLVSRLRAIDSENSGPDRWAAAYVAVFRATLEQDGRMCLCGILAAEIDAVPEEVQVEVRRFVDLNVQWISTNLARAMRVDETSVAVRDHARAVFAALEGAMLVARGTGDIGSFDAMARQFERVGLLGS